MKCNALACLKALGFLTIISVLLNSCADREQNDLKVMDMLNNSLEKSVETISKNTAQIIGAFEDRVHDIRNRERVAIWQPKALYIKERIAGIITYLHEIKNTLLMVNINDDEHNLKKAQKDITRKILLKDNLVYNLYDSLKKYKKEILNSDLQVQEIFRDRVSIALPFLQAKDSAEFYDIYFNNTSLVSALAVLSSFENGFISIENQIINYCFYQTYDGCDLGMTTFSILIGQSTTHIKANEQLVINAGVGEFSAAAAPKITINGKKMDSKNGFAEYKLKGSDKPGKHYVPVKIEYIGEDGNSMTSEQNIEYTVDE